MPNDTFPRALAEADTDAQTQAEWKAKMAALYPEAFPRDAQGQTHVDGWTFADWSRMPRDAHEDEAASATERNQVSMFARLRAAKLRGRSAAVQDAVKKATEEMLFTYRSGGAAVDFDFREPPARDDDDTLTLLLEVSRCKLRLEEIEARLTQLERDAG